jgi:septum formation protein
MTQTLVLASGSPRRKEILENLGIIPKVIVSKVDESIVDITLDPADYTMALSSLKAQAVAKELDKGLVIGSDTVVVDEGKILGQPSDEIAAFDMLTSLSGKWHSVISGISVINVETGEEVTDYEETRVCFKKLSDAEIHAYIATGEPMDKAGAYGIQGVAGLFVERMEGGYYNVVGLPLYKLYCILQKFNYSLLHGPSK